MATSRVLLSAYGGFWLPLTLFLLGVGNYGGGTALIQAGGITGIIVAVLAACLSASGARLAAYGRDVLPAGSLSKGVA